MTDRPSSPLLPLYAGSIPAAIGALPKLRRLDLSHNQLEGSIPLKLTQLPELQELILCHNRLSGLLAAVLYVHVSASRSLHFIVAPAATTTQLLLLLLLLILLLLLLLLLLRIHSC